MAKAKRVSDVHAVSGTAGDVMGAAGQLVCAAGYYLREEFKKVDDEITATALRSALNAASRRMHVETGYHLEDCKVLVQSNIEWMYDRDARQAATAARKAKFNMGGDWYAYGCPTIQLGHRLAASLAVTTVSTAVLNDLHPPFPVAVVELPSGIVSVNGVSARAAMLGQVSAKREDDGVPYTAWAIWLLFDTAMSLWQSGDSLEKLLKHDFSRAEEGSTAEETELAQQLGAETARALLVAAKVCVGALLSFDDHAKPVGKGDSTWRSNGGRHGEEPTRRVFQITADIKHDFRKAVAEYIGGSTSALSVQFVVCGHWKMQPHGPRNTLRRRQFIEPYWKGDVGSPIALRKHKLTLPEDTL